MTSTGSAAAFAAAHGPCVAVINYLGRVGARTVIIGADGAFMDLITPDVDTAQQFCAAAELPVQAWSRELNSRLMPRPADRRRMAGSGR